MNVLIKCSKNTQEKALRQGSDLFVHDRVQLLKKSPFSDCWKSEMHEIVKNADPLFLLKLIKMESPLLGTFQLLIFPEALLRRNIFASKDCRKHFCAH